MRKTWKRAMGWCLAFVMAAAPTPAVFADSQSGDLAEPGRFAEITTQEQVDRMVADFIAAHEGELSEQDLADAEEGRVRYGAMVEREAESIDVVPYGEDGQVNAAVAPTPSAPSTNPADYATGELKTQTTVTGFIRKDGRSASDTTYWHGFAALYKVTDGQMRLVEKQDTGTTGQYTFLIGDGEGMGAGEYRLVVSDETVTLARNIDFHVYQTRFSYTYDMASASKPILIYPGDLDQDGVISQADYDTYVSNYMGRYGITEDSPDAPYDFDGNGTINVFDGIMLSNRLNMVTADYSPWVAGWGEIVAVQDPAEAIKVKQNTPESELPAFLPTSVPVVFGEFDNSVRELPILFWIGDYDLTSLGSTYTVLGVLDTSYEDTWAGETYTAYYNNDHHVAAMVTIDVVEDPIVTPTPTPTPAQDYIPQIVAGKNFVMGLAQDGTVYGEGKITNSLAIGATVEQWNELQGEQRVKTIYASDLNIVGLTHDGHVKCAGALANIGEGSNKQIVESWESVTQVSVSESVLAALRSDGTIVAVSNKETDEDTNGSKIADVMTNYWTNVKQFAVAENHAVAVDNNNFGAGYHKDYKPTSTVQPPEVNFLSWLNQRQLLDLQANNKYTVGLNDNGRVQITGVYSATGTEMVLPEELTGFSVQKIRAYNPFVFALRNGEYYFIDSNINQELPAYGDKISDPVILDHYVNGTDTWTGLRDIAYADGLLVGLTADGICYDGYNRSIRPGKFAQWVMYRPEG